MPRKKKLTTPDVAPEVLEALQQVSEDALYFEVERRKREKAEAFDGEIKYVRAEIVKAQQHLRYLQEKRQQLETRKRQLVG